MNPAIVYISEYSYAKGNPKFSTYYRTSYQAIVESVKYLEYKLRLRKVQR